MVAERITPESVAAEAVAFDAQERIVVGGQTILNFGQTGAMTAVLLPREWEEVAAYLFALIGREPVKTSTAFLAHRTILSPLAQELRMYAHLAGEPIGLEADLRAASTKAEEERIRARILDQQLSRERFLDDLLLADAAQHTTERPGDWTVEDAEASQETPPDQDQAAAPAAETDDDLAYL